MEKSLKDALNLCEQILNLTARKYGSRSDYPTGGGVYLVKDANSNVIYVGKGRNLRRRICDDHISGAKDDATSTFRRSLNQKHGLRFGIEMKQWVLDNCRFVFVEIENEDLCHLVEALLILSFRSPKLLNK